VRECDDVSAANGLSSRCSDCDKRRRVQGGDAVPVWVVREGCTHIHNRQDVQPLPWALSTAHTVRITEPNLLPVFVCLPWFQRPFIPGLDFSAVACIALPCGVFCKPANY
jgi:hypothetical protein